MGWREFVNGLYITIFAAETGTRFSDEPHDNQVDHFGIIAIAI